MNKLKLIKYGGNAMTDHSIMVKLLQNINELKSEGNQIILVHGGGPFIKEALDYADIESEFIDGQRTTSPEALVHIEMALKGRVNGTLVRILNKFGAKAVGLSGKDGKFVIAKKRFAKQFIDGQEKLIDLGQVGDVKEIHTGFLRLLIDHDYLPVVTCIASDDKGADFNINADVFAGHLAGAMQASEFIILTDVNGLMRDVKDKDSLISEIRLQEIDNLIQQGIIKGGMIPKLEACKTALQLGANKVRIINGTQPDQLLKIIKNQNIGTLISC